MIIFYFYIIKKNVKYFNNYEIIYLNGLLKLYWIGNWKNEKEIIIY